MIFDESVDRYGMRGHLEAWGRQFRAGWNAGLEYGGFSRVEPPRALIWAGMGGSAIGGDFCTALAAGTAPMPIIVHRGGPLPAWVNERDRVLLVSYSGNTAETLATAATAQDRGCGLDAMTSGGKLADWARERGITPWTVAGGRPPRAALGTLFGCSFGALVGRGWCRVAEGELEEAFAFLDKAAERFGSPPENPDHPLFAMMEGLADRLPMVYGMGCLVAVARRWSGQINENAKRPAHWAEFPEMNHNEVVAFREGSVWGERGAIILLVDPDSPADVLVRVEVTLELAAKAGWKGWALRPESRFPLGRVLEMTLVGDWLSYWMAVAQGLDPTPIPTIDALKAALEKLS